jgi:hypothetical protein
MEDPATRGQVSLCISVINFFLFQPVSALRSAFWLHGTDIDLESTLFKYYASIQIEM